MCRVSSSSSFMDSTVKVPPLSSPETEKTSLLDLAANNDLSAFKLAVESAGAAAGVDLPAPWYSRSIGPASSPIRRMAYAPRTPAMIAALYGSTDVLQFILTLASPNVNRRCDSDGVTALHCAAAGGSSSSLAAVKLLINASADIDAVDASGNRPGDVIAKQFSAPMARELEILLKAPCPRVASPSKKEFPVDLTLPDIKNGIYGTDEFRMYAFKVKPCSRAYSHDWTECPFVHPGENARRRDPRKFSYSCVPCPDFRKGSCLKSDSCEFAHGVFECWLHPAQYRTRLCKDETGCGRRVCFFAHKVEELRMVNPTAASVAGHVLASPRSADVVSALMSAPSAAGWMASSRLKASLSAREMELDIEQKMFDEMSMSVVSPRGNWKANCLNSGSDFNDLFGSIDASMLSQLQGLGSGYGNSVPSSPTVSASSSFGVDHLMAKAIMNSRQAAFAKRSQSFIDRGAVPRHLPALSAAPGSPIAISDWGSPGGKLDWGIQGDELNKMRKSTSFNFRSNGSNNFGGKLSADEPDLSWVQHLVKDGPAATALPRIGRIGLEQQKQYQSNGAGNGNFLSWDQVYAEKERMQEVA